MSTSTTRSTFSSTRSAREPAANSSVHRSLISRREGGWRFAAILSVSTSCLAANSVFPLRPRGVHKLDPPAYEALPAARCAREADGQRALRLALMDARVEGGDSLGNPGRIGGVGKGRAPAVVPSAGRPGGGRSRARVNNVQECEDQERDERVRRPGSAPA